MEARFLSIIMIPLYLLLGMFGYRTDVEVEPHKQNINGSKIDEYSDTEAVDKKKSAEMDNKSEENKDISGFIPKGWHLLDTSGDSKVEGDLNGDEITDIAFVIEGDKEEELGAPRTLMIITGNPDGTYTLAAKGEKVILRKYGGGIMGDPFMGLSINRGSLLVGHYGGSAWRWGKSYRFRYEGDGWYLIGATEDWFHAVSNRGKKYEDINLLTGDYKMIETDDNGVEKHTEGNRGKKKLVNLVDFDTNGDRQF
ncbi:hypothetical protein [Dethiothermospora halolimnae]|uniref:hypothetical protein n=1 Tax=Dethiothermospora halolimnae TaxID=3114390 RepID=UPI003CCBAD7E